MDAIEALLSRVSVPVLGGPEITSEQKEILMRAAARAADHAWLRPSRYLLLEGEGLAALGDVFCSDRRTYGKFCSARAPEVYAKESTADHRCGLQTRRAPQSP